MRHLYTVHNYAHAYVYNRHFFVFFFFRVTTRATVECTRVSIHLYSTDFAKNRCCNVIFCFSWCWCSSHINKKTAQNMAQYPQRKIIGTHLHMEVSWNGGTGTPKSSILTSFNRMFHYKPTILGIPHLWKPARRVSSTSRQVFRVGVHGLRSPICPPFAMDSAALSVLDAPMHRYFFT